MTLLQGMGTDSDAIVIPLSHHNKRNVIFRNNYYKLIANKLAFLDTVCHIVLLSDVMGFNTLLLNPSQHEYRNFHDIDHCELYIYFKFEFKSVTS